MKGKYRLKKDSLNVRVQGMEILTLEKGHVIRVASREKHGDVLIDYGQGVFAWKHASVLEDFERV